MERFIPAVMMRYHHPYESLYSRVQPPMLQSYFSYTEPLLPLDLSLKTSAPITPPCTPSPPRKRQRLEEHNNNEYLDLDKEATVIEVDSDSNPEAKKEEFSRKFFEELDKSVKGVELTNVSEDSPTDVCDRPKKQQMKGPTLTKKSKAVRRLNFDEDKTSPVSGTIIRELGDDETLVVRKGDIDPAFNVVEVTEEAKASLATIENRLGRYICRLCRQLYGDAFALAQHRCSRIVHIEYRCPECDKVFNCPANLASHRRWHKPRVPSESKTAKKVPEASGDGESQATASEDHEPPRYTCTICGRIFRREAYLRKHYAAHQAFEDNNKTAIIQQSGFDPRCAAQAELSAFTQVKSTADKYRSFQDSNCNSLWKVSNLVPGYFLPDVASAAYRLPLDYAGLTHRRATSVANSDHSDDSQMVDITGSEDELSSEPQQDEESVN